MPSSFAVKTEVYEGPLELLLDLIERRKLLINDISLATVTDDYIAHVRELQDNHLGETSHFVLIAATLLLIKSKSLLPVLELTEEESHSVADLESRLRLYQIYRDRARQLTEIFGARILFEKTYVASDEPIFTPDQRTTKEALKEALFETIRRFPKTVFRPQVSVKKVMSLEDMITRLEERVTRQIKLSFKDFVSSGERADLIVGFLALLELVKQGTVLVNQEAHFHDILIERDVLDLPKYS